METKFYEEGVNYKVPDGFEKIYNRDGSVSITKIPNVKKGDFVHLNDSYYGILKSYENRRAVCSLYGRMDDCTLFGAAYNLVADEIRLATPEEKQAFIDLIHANKHDLGEYSDFICIYRPENPKYGVKFVGNKFVACGIDEASDLQKFETKNAAEMHATILNRKINYFNIK
jgi:hypothetical protein